MSSSTVRTAFKNFLTANAPLEKLVDLTDLFGELKDDLKELGISPGPWLGVEFIGNDETPITVGATNTRGKYREQGAVYVHVVDIAKLGGSASILARAESLRALLRGQRLGTVIVESVTPPNFETGATLRFDGGYVSASFLVAYENDLDL